MKILELKEIRENLRRGDYKVIAEISECSLETVRAIIQDRRSGLTDLGQKVIQVASAIVNKRLELQEEYKK